jgi:hypothetical protein|tara:strand:+ start:260 stop:583 length:324 start_codon:yes stop_codon:yes gene_type:complete
MNKYRNIPVVIDGIRFASKAEGRRYSELKLLEKAGEISKLELQPRYKIIVEGILICTYVADFKFEQRHKSGMFFTVVEDVKGILTPIYKLKKKLVKAVCGVDIKEVK